MSQEPSWGLAFFAHEGLSCKGAVNGRCISVSEEKRPSTYMHVVKEISGLYSGGAVIPPHRISVILACLLYQIQRQRQAALALTCCLLMQTTFRPHALQWRERFSMTHSLLCTSQTVITIQGFCGRAGSLRHTQITALGLT